MQKSEKFNQRLQEFHGSVEDLVKQEPEWIAEPPDTQPLLLPLSERAKRFLQHLARATAALEWESVQPSDVVISLLEFDPPLRGLAEQRGLTIELLRKGKSQNGSA